jgi:hypothetical protein
VAEAPVAEAPAPAVPSNPFAAPVTHAGTGLLAPSDLPQGPPAQAAQPQPAQPQPVRPHPVQPQPAPAPVPVGAAAALPARRPVPSSVPAPSAPSEDLDRMAARSDLASTALSELRGLYEPTFAPEVQRPAADTADAGLARRTPKASAPAPAPAPAVGPAETRPSRRTASEVRGMLSGFRAGVERGRAPQDASTDPTHPTS